MRYRFLLYVFVLLFASSVGARPPQCTLSASPAILSGESSILTAICSPTATSFEWSGGTCTGMIGSICMVAPLVTTVYSVFGINADGASTAVSKAVFVAWPYNGIYQWGSGYFLSVHRIGGDTIIGTIYWVYTDNPVQVGTRIISEVDTFDLFDGQIVGSNVTMKGTRFFRACEITYDFIFNNDSSLTIHQTGVSNSPGVSVSDVNCAAKYIPGDPNWTIPKIF